MISGVFGLPGSGKTLYLSFLGTRALAGKSLRFANLCLGTRKNYDFVFSSFPLSGAFCLDYDTLGKVEYRNSLFLIDEIMMFADSRSFQSFTPELKFFFSQHRHFGIDIVYASQAYDDCDKKIRGVTDHFYYIKRSFPGYSIVRPIQSYFRVESGVIHQGYKYGGVWRNYWFRRSKYYDQVDTTFSVSKPDFEAHTFRAWGQKNENQEHKEDEKRKPSKADDLLENFLRKT